MAAVLSRISDEALITVDNLLDRAGGLLRPTLRFGVTGLSRAGKTVFITALVHNLLHGGRLPLFKAQQSGRIASAYLEPQPDDGVPRFQYEDHVRALVDERLWPQSTRAISELRLTIEYESASAWNRLLSPGKLSIDIIDYPGEWLLDLPLLNQDYRTFSDNAVALARSPARADLSRQWLEETIKQEPGSAADETFARRNADLFADYLRACRSDERALSTLPPGRFLMPGDLEGSPALTFAPLPDLPEGSAPSGSLWSMMDRRFEAYKSLVVKPFFRDHFARLDRQIILIDAMQAMNAGPEAVQDLERALVDILSCFRPGRNNLLTSLIARRIDRVLIGATKADQLHHESHDRLEAIVRRIVDQAMRRAGYDKADIEVVAMAAVRATREASAKRGREKLPLIVGTPMEGERIDGQTFDGKSETGIFPGDLPQDADAFFKQMRERTAQSEPPLNFVRFRPPRLERTAEGMTLSLPHIRLDRAFEFLFGDWLA
ncbi:YcjX family protein [Hoeflea prorocentri]|uniref:YcjX family protein n=1 Tax=Hoeflea prorocentri TaxID=1922333 RepID=A0A9X3UGR7_9HYPH|nr:YcjX family protein [Hoeflea prorocentri]MCY6380334.1 YcjX family protein [Hoeflea prorocentri]MDA5398134.1 YcjX family protein [Hoeflea prorocentri]